MRISDWSSDVCSSDLEPAGELTPDGRLADAHHPDQNDGLADPLTAGVPLAGAFAHAAIRVRPASRCRSLNMCFHLIYTSRPAGVGNVAQSLPMGIRGTGDHLSQIGRASRRERLCQYV